MDANLPLGVRGKPVGSPFVETSGLEISRVNINFNLLHKKIIHILRKPMISETFEGY